MRLKKRVKRSTQSSNEPLRVPFTVLVDGREQLPYHFDGFEGGASVRHRPLVVPWEWSYLKTGDYSIKGCAHLVAVERKTLEDLYRTLGQERERFEREHERMAELDYAAVVVEAPWYRILKEQPKRSRLAPKVVFRTALSWSIKYRVPWFTVEGRRLAEATTFRLLEKWWVGLQDELGETSSLCRKCGRPLSAHKSYARGMGPVCAAKGDRLLASKIERGLR